MNEGDDGVEGEYRDPKTRRWGSAAPADYALTAASTGGGAGASAVRRSAQLLQGTEEGPRLRRQRPPPLLTPRAPPLGFVPLSPSPSSPASPLPAAAAGDDGPATPSRGATADDALAPAYEPLSLFAADEDDDDDASDADEVLPWYRRRSAAAHAAAFLLAAALLVVGVCSHGAVAAVARATGAGRVELFRWMYFFALWPPLWVATRLGVKRAFGLVERAAFNDAILFLDGVRRTATRLVFALLTLPWHRVVFTWAWCEGDGGGGGGGGGGNANGSGSGAKGGGACSAHNYVRATGVLWSLLACLALFTLAEFLKTLAAKLLSSAFYRTAHFQKVKSALDKEFYLTQLSRPRPRAARPTGSGPLLSRKSVGAAAAAAAAAAADGDDNLFRSAPDGLRGMGGGGGSFASVASFVGRRLRRFTAEPTGMAAEASGAGGAGRRMAKSLSQGARGGADDDDGACEAAGDGSKSYTGGAGLACRSLPSYSHAAAERTAAAAAAATSPLSPLSPTARRPQAEADDAAAAAAGDDDGDGRPPASCKADSTTNQRSVLLHVRAAGPSDGGGSDTARGSYAGGTDDGTIGGGGAEAAASGREAHGGANSSLGWFKRLWCRRCQPQPGATEAPPLQQQPSQRRRSGSSRRLARATTLSASGAGAGGLGGSGASATGAPQLQPEVLDAINLTTVDGKKVDAARMRPAEWERLRAGIAVRTLAALAKQYAPAGDAADAARRRAARRFARGLFWNVKGDARRDHVTRADFDAFFADKALGDQAFAYFDKDFDGVLTAAEVRSSVMAIFDERRKMAASLEDTDSIVRSLQFGVGCALHLVMGAAYLLVWGVDVLKGFSTFSALVLAFTFVFGNSVRNVYESMLFLFVEHVFDVGDLLEVDGALWRVKQIDLMYTVLIKGTGERVWYPNARLLQAPLANLSRTQHRAEAASFAVDSGRAGLAVRQALIARLARFFEENRSELAIAPVVNFAGLEARARDPLKVRVSVYWQCTFSADEDRRWRLLRTALLAEVQETLADVDALAFTIERRAQGDGNDTAAAAADGDDGGTGGGGGGGEGVGEAAAPQGACDTTLPPAGGDSGGTDNESADGLQQQHQHQHQQHQQQQHLQRSRLALISNGRTGGTAASGAGTAAVMAGIAGALGVRRPHAAAHPAHAPAPPSSSAPFGFSGR